MSSPTIFDARRKLAEVGLTLQATDFKWFVYMVTHDSVMIFRRAIVKRYGDWVLIWTEHTGYHTEHQDHIVQLCMGEADPNLERIPV